MEKTGKYCEKSHAGRKTINMEVLQREITYEATWLKISSITNEHKVYLPWNMVTPALLLGNETVTINDCNYKSGMYRIEIIRGYGARFFIMNLSCTPWSVHDTENDALAYLDMICPE